MTAKKNIVNFGLAKSGWGEITEDSAGNDVLGALHMLAGTRAVNFNPTGELMQVYADGTVVFVGRSNAGYTGSMEVTLADEDFRKYILSEEVDSKNVQYEKQTTEVKRFYLVWEWVNDQKNTRHIMYNLTANRTALAGTTKSDGGNDSSQPETINLIASPRKLDGFVKANTRYDVDATVYNNWFTSPYFPTDSSDFAVTVNVKTGTTNLAGALVVLGDGSQGWTDADGNAVFYKPAGTYDVFVSLADYTAVADSVTVTNAAVTKNIALTAS
ncbi:MAG: major tail protein [Flexilinea sp.]